MKNMTASRDHSEGMGSSGFDAAELWDLLLPEPAVLHRAQGPLVLRLSMVPKDGPSYTLPVSSTMRGAVLLPFCH